MIKRFWRQNKSWFDVDKKCFVSLNMFDFYRYTSFIYLYLKLKLKVYATLIRIAPEWSHFEHEYHINAYWTPTTCLCRMTTTFFYPKGGCCIYRMINCAVGPHYSSEFRPENIPRISKPQILKDHCFGLFFFFWL